LDTLPGLTGWWKLHGRSRTAFNEMMRLDLWYIQHNTLWLELGIIARSPPTLAARMLEVRRPNLGAASPQFAKAVL
jgi:lipopolysaccharide/colanic/teichoic acid biosynthesis glycosyltransferase